jgi:PadR family transcriptional regulator, regulatory protein AphA
MSLDYAILGFLNYHPYSGYDLKKIFDTSVRHFWPADQSQIYRTLARLTEQGFASLEKIEQEDRPDRKVYHITDAGRTELINWLAGPPPMDPSRSASLIQVFFAGQLTNEAILAKFEMVTQGMRDVLAQYDQVPGQLEEHARIINSPREQFFWLLTLDLGLRTMRANLEWAENIIQQLQKGAVPDK